MMKLRRILNRQSLNLYVATWADLKKQCCFKKASAELHIFTCNVYDICLYFIYICRYIYIDVGNVDTNLEGKHIKLIRVITSGEGRREWGWRWKGLQFYLCSSLLQGDVFMSYVGIRNLYQAKTAQCYRQTELESMEYKG